MTRLRPLAAGACLVLLINACGTSDDPQPTSAPTEQVTPSVAPGGPTEVNPVGSSGPPGVAPTPVGPTSVNPSPQPSSVAPSATQPSSVAPTGSVTPINPNPPVSPTGPVEPTPEQPVPVEPEPVVLPSLVVSSDAGGMWKEGTVEVVSSGSPSVTVDTTTTFQTWLGFGGTFNEKGWTALSTLSEADRQTAMKLLFSKAEGAAFTWGRIPMGASDYADSRYSLNETPNDYDMASFSLARDEMKLIPFIKAAQAVKSDIKFWASPWSPPSWLKTKVTAGDGMADLSLITHDMDTGWMRSDAEALNAYAKYFVKFVQGYAEHGIPIDHVQPQNEPGWQQMYPTCGWGQSDIYRPSGNARITNNGAAKLSTFVKDYLKKGLQDAGLTTKVWMGTLSNGALFNFYMEGITPDVVEGVGLQWGTQPEVGRLANQGYLVMQSEHKCGNYPWGKGAGIPAYVTHQENQQPTQTAPNDFGYGQETWDLIKSWIEDGVNIYSAWNMVLDQHGTNLDAVRVWNQNALLVANTDTKQLVATPAYYVFRHFSQFVEPQAKRVESTNTAVAFKNPDGSVAVVVRTTAAGNQTVSIDGTLLQFAATGNGWATVYWKP
jgi:glucosylceramidase